MIQPLQDALRQAQQTLKPSALAPGEKRVFRIEVPIDSLDCLHWLHAQQGARKFYWKTRDGSFEVAGFGVADAINCDEHGRSADVFTNIQERLGNQSGRARYFGGLRFDPQRRADKNWLAFGRAAFVLPEIEISRRKERSVLAWQALLDRDSDLDAILAAAQQSCAAIRAVKTPVVRSIDVRARRDVPDLNGWTKMIERVVDAASIEDVSKVVLARCSSLYCSEVPDPIDILVNMRSVDPNTYLFAFSLEDRTFLGAPPERLYKRAGTSIETEALAGTRPRGRTDAEDENLGDELLQSAKDRYEHALVWERISRQLKMLGVTVDEQREVRLMRLARVQHLYSFVDGRMSSSIAESHLLEALHPTPAVGGEPRGMARDLIEELEDVDRGWYAGPIGWVANDASEFAVAIRSALLHGPALHYYSGAGIVAASDPISEWSEIENKMSAFLSALAGNGGRTDNRSDANDDA